MFNHTVGGQNPAPVGRWFDPVFKGCHGSLRTTGELYVNMSNTWRTEDAMPSFGRSECIAQMHWGVIPMFQAGYMSL